MLFGIIEAIVTFSQVHPIQSIILITLLPITELRASILYGIIELKLPWLTVFLVAVLSNILLAVILYPIIDKLIWLVTRIKLIDRLYNKHIENTQHKIKKYIDRYGELGLAIFIGIPLPGSGVYTGALAAYLLGFKYKKFIIASIIGVLIAGAIVTIASLAGGGILSIFLKGI